MRVEGREHLRISKGRSSSPSNHQSHMDVPVILAALPRPLRARVAPAMAKEFFKAHFFPAGHTWRECFTNSVNYYLAAFYFNAFPLPQRGSGRAADAQVHWRADRRRMVGLDLSGGRAVDDGRTSSRFAAASG